MPFAPRKAPQGTNPAVLLLEKTVVGASRRGIE